MLGIGLSLTSRLRGSAFSPVSLFRSNEPGIVIDPSDLSTLLTDTAGTTPVTAPGQTVALALDKSKGRVLGPELVTNGDFSAGSGWELQAGVSIASGQLVFSSVSSTFGARQNIIAVSGRRYQITYTIVSISLGSVSARIGATQQDIQRNTAGTYTETVEAVGSGLQSFAIIARGTTTAVIDNISVRELPGNHLTQSVAAARPIYGRHPARGYVNQLVNSDTVVTQNVTVQGVAMTLSFTGTGTVTLSGASTAGPLVGTGANNRVSLAFTPSAGTLTLTVSGDVRLGQLERETLTAYQRTGASNGLAFPRPVSYDITEAGVPSLHYLFCDGLARWMVSPTITPGVDKAQVFAGVRKLSDAARGTIVSFSPDITANNGAFALTAPAGASATFGFESKGTTLTDAVGTFAAPTTRVVAGLGDIAGDRSTLRVNGAQVDQDTGDQGTGNYLAYQLFLGARGGTANYLNGLVYSFVARFGPNLPDATIQQVERWTAQRSGVTLP